ncbi:hypothetical protein A2115_00955 [Candidatus Woesebacteria bacterium GWA1_41_8]|uniref:Lipoprotein n=1 Tax=Candidatus Woesebacteria bacterium GWA1_41_8 TaxID=1802471 RepID=A0A1F7WKJ1_9BACT|nr:MAG: hypothetical protein A2115_00955 [Candidatus Woesebacteria bacterium GWA1_41_8]
MRGERKISRLKSVANIIVAGALGACSSLADTRDTPTPILDSTSTFFPTETWMPTPGKTVTAFVPATSTPGYAELQVSKPYGVRGEVVIGEAGYPQLAVGLPAEYGSVDGKIVIAERRYGEWRLMPFSFRLDPENMLQVLKSHTHDNFLYGLDSGVVKNSLVYSIITGELVGVKLDINAANRVELTWILASDGRVFKIKPDVFVVGARNGTERTEYDIENLDVQSVATMLGFLSTRYPKGNAYFSIMLNSLVGGASYPEVESICRLNGERFDQLCRQLAQNQDRLVESRQEMDRLVENYEFWPRQDQVREEAVWWDDYLFKPFPEELIASAVVVILTDG